MTQGTGKGKVYKSRDIYGLWNYKNFNLENLDDAQCLTNFK